MTLGMFWGMVAVLSVLAIGLPALALLRARRSEGESGRARSIAVYRDQLREIERDAGRGVISPTEAERLRLEVSRRLLEADSRAQAVVGPSPRAMRGTALAVAIAMVPLALWVYVTIGAPGYPDLPLAKRHADAAELRAARPSQAELEAMVPDSLRPRAPDPEHAELVAQLRAILEQRPDDLQGHLLLAENQVRLGEYGAAAQTQRRVIALRGDQAGSGDYAALADYLILAAGGIVSPEAEAALESALRRDPANGVALFYSGLMFGQTGREDLTFQIWRRLHDQSPGDAPWMAQIRAALPELAQIAGERYSLPPLPPVRGTGPGPSLADIEAAEALDDDARAEMVEGMVARLSNRLANQGGSPDEWAQLIRALGVLGRDDRALAVWEEAQVRFAAEPEALDPIRDAARDAGVTQ